MRLSGKLIDSLSHIGKGKFLNTLNYHKPERFNFLDIEAKDNKAYISYLHLKHIGSMSSSDWWSSPLRVKGRPAVVFKKIFPDLSEDFLREITELLNVQVDNSNIEVRTVTGDDIWNVYQSCNYHSSIVNGTFLKNSCMNDKNYFDLYTQNSDKISAAVAYLDGKIVARALLWTIRQDAKRVRILDRVYYGSLAHETSILKWAKTNVDLIRGDSVQFYEPGHKNAMKYRIFNFRLNEFKFMRYPYLDTFQFLNLNNGVMSNRHSDISVELTSTSGAYILL